MPAASTSCTVGVYSDLVEHYNQATIHGHRRAFPEKLLLGAEKILARAQQKQVLHWRDLGKGESRPDSATRRTRPSSPSTRRPRPSLKRKSEWDPHSLLMILDGWRPFDAAWTLIHLGDETFTSPSRHPRRPSETTALARVRAKGKPIDQHGDLASLTAATTSSMC